jgi:hypothetical protein
MLVRASGRNHKVLPAESLPDDAARRVVELASAWPCPLARR